jgi:CubicO group peptidase (beta-lactamase class C family)
MDRRLGASSFAAYAGDELVMQRGDVDMPGLILSGTKGLVAMCMLLLIERGLLDLDAPVARYWPEFRDDVLVRQVVSHTSGVAGVLPPLEAEDLLDDVRMEERVAAQAPFWPPGTAVGYHALTYGWLCGGLVRRIDGRSVGTFFAAEVARPLDLELWIGRPQREPAQLTRAPGYAVNGEPSELLDALYGPMVYSFPWNRPEFHHVEIPGANAIGTARSIARLYASLEDVLSPETIRLGRTELSRGTCVVTGRPYAFGVGFELQTELGALGPPPDAFGHTGSGGSSHGCWPTDGIGFSYVPTELRKDDTRAIEVLRELHSGLR